MAITKVGESTFTVGSGTGTEDKTLPTVQTGDVVLVGVACDNALAAGDGGIATSSGYTDIFTSLVNGDIEPAYHVVYKVMGATPDTVVTLDQMSNQIQSGVIQVWRGVDTTTPMDATPVFANSGGADNTSIDPPSLTTVTDGALRVLFGGLDDDDNAAGITAPSGYADLIAADTGRGLSGGGSTIMLASKEAATAGAEDPGAFTSSTADKWVSGHFALRPAAGGGISLTADAGSYAVTGTAASLEHGREVVAAAGSYAVTGTAADLEYGFALDADSGSYAISGTDAAFVHDRAVIADAGSYSISGTAASLEHGREVVAGAGSYAISGTDATLTIAADKTIAADAGSYSITGTAASLELGREVVADAGSYAITGTAAALEHGREVAADAGSYSISGTVALLEHGREVVADAGSYAISGTDAALEHVTGPVLVADAGSYAITGTAASLEHGREIVAEAGSYAITGTAATLTKGVASSRDRNGGSKGRRQYPTRRQVKRYRELLRQIIEAQKDDEEEREALERKIARELARKAETEAPIAKAVEKIAPQVVLWPDPGAAVGALPTVDWNALASETDSIGLVLAELVGMAQTVAAAEAERAAVEAERFAVEAAMEAAMELARQADEDDIEVLLLLAA